MTNLNHTTTELKLSQATFDLALNELRSKIEVTKTIESFFSRASHLTIDQQLVFISKMNCFDNNFKSTNMSAEEIKSEGATIINALKPDQLDTVHSFINALLVLNGNAAMRTEVEWFMEEFSNFSQSDRRFIVEVMFNHRPMPVKQNELKGVA